MGKTCKQNYDTKYEEFLNPDKQTKVIADKCDNTALTDIDEDIINKLGEQTPGFSKEALYINGYSPIADLVAEIKNQMTGDLTTINGLKQSIMQEGNTHTVQEVKEFKEAITKEYEKRKEAFYDAINNYNNEVNSHNAEVDKEVQEENSKKTQQPGNILDNNNNNNTGNGALTDPIELMKKKWILLKNKETGDYVDEFHKETTDSEPIQDNKYYNDVINTRKDYQDGFDDFIQVYAKVKDWQNLDTGTTTTSPEEKSVKIADEFKKYDYETFKNKKYDVEEFANDGTKVVTVKKDDGSVEYYRYDTDGNLIELHVKDANKKDSYYTGTGLPATKYEKDNPQSPVIPTSVIDGVAENDKTKYPDGSIVIHRKEGKDGKSVFYTYDKNGKIQSIKDENGVNTTGEALCFEDSKYSTTKNYEIPKNHQTLDKNSTTCNGIALKTVENKEDGSTAEYMYNMSRTDSNGNADVLQVHVRDENGNNYYYTADGTPAGNVSTRETSAVIPNKVLEGSDNVSSTSDMTNVVTRTENGEKVYYTYQDGVGCVSINDANGKPATGEHLDTVVKIEDNKSS